MVVPDTIHLSDRTHLLSPGRGRDSPRWVAYAVWRAVPIRDSSQSSPSMMWSAGLARFPCGVEEVSDGAPELLRVGLRGVAGWGGRVGWQGWLGCCCTVYRHGHRSQNEKIERNYGIPPLLYHFLSLFGAPSFVAYQIK